MQGPRCRQKKQSGSTPKISQYLSKFPKASHERYSLHLGHSTCGSMLRVRFAPHHLRTLYGAKSSRRRSMRRMDRAARLVVNQGNSEGSVFAKAAPGQGGLMSSTEAVSEDLPPRLAASRRRDHFLRNGVNAIPGTTSLQLPFLRSTAQAPGRTLTTRNCKLLLR